MTPFCWLPPTEDFRARLKAAGTAQDGWAACVALARTRLDFSRTNALDQAVQARFGDAAPPGAGSPAIRLAVLGSSTSAHLHGALRVAGLRRSLHISTYGSDYGQYLQELEDPRSALHRFCPNSVLFCLDAPHLTAGVAMAEDAAGTERLLQTVLAHIDRCWRLAREAFGATILQQAVMPVFPLALGQNEHRDPASPAAFGERLNAALRARADAEGIDIVAVDIACREQGMAAWHDAALWCRAKQEVAPAIAPLYGDLVMRVVAARLGRSGKCLVLDLDNTLWGGVIGDDGLSGIVLGQGSALGEGFIAVQNYAKALARRGVILAVCSKNDDATAREAFDRHPDMVLRLSDIACFRANWDDKPANLRAIAADLNIGLDSLVFLDDNPFERNLIRQALPMVAVPELPDDEPALWPGVLAAAGYFESIGLTEEDRRRSTQYQDNKARDALRQSATDLTSYLGSLAMRLQWGRFDAVNRQRIVQLINKTNQFNVTTRRYGEAEYDSVMSDPNCIGLYLRLLDRFGDNGIIAVIIGRRQLEGALLLDTWLMSCRVLGREVEVASLAVIAAEARRKGVGRLLGEYYPTAKNGLVRDHFRKLGFTLIAETPDGVSRWILDLDRFQPAETPIAIEAV